MTPAPRLLTWRHVALVFLGGTLGTGARILATTLVQGEFGIMLVNVAGAFLLGVLTARLARSTHPARRELQLTVGVGALGGFTTYSALAVHATSPTWILWAAVTVVLGSLAAWLGLACGGHLGRAADRRIG